MLKHILRPVRLAKVPSPLRSFHSSIKMAAAVEETIFDKIIAKKIPSTAVYEDDLCYAFRDIQPAAATHILLVPKVRGGLSQLQFATEADKPLLGHLMWAAAEIARKEGMKEGWRLVVNDGKGGCQSVYHLHMHILAPEAGETFTWPPGTGKPEGSMKG